MARSAGQRWHLASATLVIGAFVQAANAGEAAEAVESALAAASRPAADVRRDADRKPAEVLAFAELEPGDKIAQFLPRDGYWVEVFCNVVGESGRVYSVALPAEAPQPSPAAKGAAATSGCRNVTSEVLKGRVYPAPELRSESDDPGAVYEYYMRRLPIESYVPTEPLDMLWIADTYHALRDESYGSPSLTYIGTALLRALKFGGTLIVADYAAKPRSGVRHTATLHRIAPEEVVRELEAVGFELVAESSLLRRAKDRRNRDAYSLGESADRFLLKFRKPGP